MAVADIFQSTSNDIFTSTSDDIWFGIVIEEIGAVITKYAARLFYLTLTGAADATTDIEIPISSFQGRRKNGALTYLSAVTHDITYLDEITARPNGQIYVEMAYVLSGVETDREEIIRANFDTPLYDEGSKSQAITLSGELQEAWVPKQITLTGQNYKRVTGISSQTLNFRFADINVYLHPGDTVTIGADTFVPSTVNYSIAATSNGINASMDLIE